MQKEVMIVIEEVKYYKEQSSLVIVGIEVETKKPLTQQIMIKHFLNGTGRFTSDEVEKIINDPDRCRLLASQLKQRREPFKVVFEDTKKEGDEI